VDKAAFFDMVRKAPFGGSLSAKQVAGMEAFLNHVPSSRAIPHLAYELATQFHETGEKMVPVVENLNYTTAAQIRKTWPTRFASDAAAAPYVKNPQLLANKVYGGRMGNVGANDGWTFRGRGGPQLTGRDMYRKAGDKLGIDLESNPDRMLEPDISAKVTDLGMSEGWFTGKKLGDYDTPQGFSATSARAIINGDVAANGAKIAGYCSDFAKALTAAGWGTQAPAEPEQPTPAPTPEVDRAQQAAYACIQAQVTVSAELAKAFGLTLTWSLTKP